MAGWRLEPPTCRRFQDGEDRAREDLGGDLAGYWIFEISAVPRSILHGFSITQLIMIV
jgi:hypothetical protein